MKIFVTGVSGYIGSMLVEKLLELNHQVSGLIREESRVKQINNSCKLYEYKKDIKSIRNALQEFKPDIIIHLASLFLQNHESEDINRLFESNILLNAYLYQSMLDVGVKKIINTGTSWEYYNQINKPVNLYAATKIASEKLLEYYIDVHNFKVINLKLFDSYGPKDKRKKLFYYLRNAVRSRDYFKISPGDQLLNLVYIDDTLSAYTLAINEIENGLNKNTFGVGGNKLITLKELVDCYSRVLGVPIPVLFGALNYRDREVMIPWQKFDVVPGWVPKMDLEEGIYRMEIDESIGGILSGDI